MAPVFNKKPSNFHQISVMAKSPEPILMIQSLSDPISVASRFITCLTRSSSTLSKLKKKMEILDCLYLPKPIIFQKFKQAHVQSHVVSSKFDKFAAKRTQQATRSPICAHFPHSGIANALWIGAAGIALISIVGPSNAVESPFFNEPSNALSLPTWAIHVSSVAEWVIAMALVWQYGEKSGFESWKGLSWGMVPLLGGAFCACTWHFFYNAESLEILVALQAALTVIGNVTMSIAAYRIYISSQESSNNS